MSFFSAMIASLSLIVPASAQADMGVADLNGTTWTIAVPGQFPATLQFTDEGASLIAACKGVEVGIADAAGASVTVTGTSEIYTCGAPGADEARIIDTLTSLEQITSETPASLTLTAKDGTTVTATR